MYSRYQLGCYVAACFLSAAFCVSAQPANTPGLTILHTFSATNYASGYSPTGAIAVGANGVLYGTTQYGGIYNQIFGCSEGCGTVYSLTPPTAPGGTWTENVLWSFGATSTDAYFPSYGVTMGPDGVLYGQSAGGPGACGTVFSLTPPAQPGGSWQEAIVYAFTCGADGGSPNSSLAIDANGVLYGTGQWGSTGKDCANGCGTVYTLTPPATPGGDWTETVLWNFSQGGGTWPIGGVVLGPGGVLYGITQNDGFSDQDGVAYSLTPPAAPGGSWTETVLYRFSLSSGQHPVALTLGANGVLYGTTYLNDKNNQQGGTIYSLTPPASPGGAWTESTLRTFPTQPYAASVSTNPYGPLLIGGQSGYLFGTTASGTGNGTVFAAAPPQAPGGNWTAHLLEEQYTIEPSIGLMHGGALYGTDWFENLVWVLVP